MGSISSSLSYSPIARFKTLGGVVARIFEAIFKIFAAASLAPRISSRSADCFDCWQTCSFIMTSYFNRGKVSSPLKN